MILLEIPRKPRRALPDFVTPDSGLAPILSPASLSTLDCSLLKSLEIPAFSKLKTSFYIPHLAHMLLRKLQDWDLPQKRPHAGERALFHLGVGLLPYFLRKSPQSPRYGFNAGRQGISAPGQCRKERKGRKN